MNDTGGTDEGDRAVCREGRAGDDAQDQADAYERCVCCHRRVGILKDTDIEFRPFYVEGAGQLCYGCYHELYVRNAGV